MATKAKVTGFGVAKTAREVKFGTSMTYGKMKLLSTIVSPTLKGVHNPAAKPAREFLGMGKDEKLNWEYGSWSDKMVATAHEALDKFASLLPPRPKFGNIL
jgi:hypothetical protein